MRRSPWTLALALSAALAAAGCGAGTVAVASSSGSSSKTSKAKPQVQRLFLPPLEQSGTYGLRFLVNSLQPVDLRLEHRVVSPAGIPGPWQLSFPVDHPDPTPPSFFQQGYVQAKATPGSVEWDAFRDLGSKVVAAVDLRLTAVRVDTGGAGSRVLSIPAVDTNFRPQVECQERTLVLDPARDPLIPIQVVVRDEEKDPVGVLLQWKYAGLEFPELGGDKGFLTAADLFELVSDDSYEKALDEDNLCRLANLALEGVIAAPPAAGLSGTPQPVRLPELAAAGGGVYARSERTVVTLDLSNADSPQAVTSVHDLPRDLEVLRAPTVAPGGWPHAPDCSAPEAFCGFLAPVDVLVRPSGSLLVLEEQGAGWRIREFFPDPVAPRAVVFASGLGRPSAMTVDARRRSLFVGTDIWIFQLDHVSGAPGDSILHGLQDAPRGLAALGDDQVVATGELGGQPVLVRYDFTVATLEPESVLLAGQGLVEPWGVVADPWCTDTLLVADRGRDAVLSVDLQSELAVPLPAALAPADVQGLGPLPLPSPRALALAPGGRQLLVLCERNGLPSLRGLYLRGPLVDPRAGPPTGPANPYVFELDSKLPEATGGLATGPDGLRAVALPGSDELALGGGVEQSRRIVSYGPGGDVVVETAFEPALVAGDRWRIRERLLDAAANENGLKNVYYWDSSVVPAGATVQVQLLAADTHYMGEDIPCMTPPPPPPAPLGVECETFVASSTSVPDPRALAVEDLDGDGDLDLVVAAGIPNRLGILYRTGKGALPQAAQLLDDPALLGPTAVVAHDLDGDGDVDLAAAGGQSDAVVLFERTPAGFVARAQLGAPGMDAPAALRVGDLDGDGLPEVVTANAGSGDLTVFAGAGAPWSFAPGVSLSAPGLSAPDCLELADLDGDGAPDLAAASGLDGTVVLFGQDGAGGFRAPTQLAGGLAAPRALVAADLDGDGDTDLACASGGPGEVGLLFQVGSGYFAPPQSVSTGFPFGLSHLAAADLDGDGDHDLAVVSEQGGAFALLLQQDPGVFELEGVSAPRCQGLLGAPRAVVARDLDADGDVDLAAVNGANQVVVLERSGPVRFEDPDSVPTDLQEPPVPVMSLPRALATADLDQDGDPDVVVTDDGSDRVFFYYRELGDQFTYDEPPGVMSDGGPAGPAEVDTADLDQDGDVDVVVSSRFGDQLMVFQQVGHRRFARTPALTHASLLGPVGVEAFDLDGDGAVDLAAASSAADTVTVLFQGQPGRFEHVVELFDAAHRTPVDVVAGDVDRDGLTDLVALYEASSELVVWRQVAPRTFARGPVGFDPALVLPGDLALADLDGDGDLDAVAVDADTLVVFLHDAAGGLVAGHTQNLSPSAGGKPKAVVACDLDGDGDVDLAATTDPFSAEDPEQVYVGIQERPGAFRPAEPARTHPDARGLLGAELGTDGRLDLLTSHHALGGPYESTLWILRGE